jgi:hypothetical protein
MRGGNLDEFLNERYVKKNKPDTNFKIEKCSTKGIRGVHSTYYVFLGNITLDDNNYFEYIIYAFEKTIIIHKLESLKKNNTNKITGLNYKEILEQTNIDRFNDIFNSLDKTEFFIKLKHEIDINQKHKNKTSHYNNLSILVNYFESIQQQ